MCLSIYIAEISEERVVLVKDLYVLFLGYVVSEESFEFGFVNPPIFLRVNKFEKTIQYNIDIVVS
jgi:hypothetical protein